MLSNGYLLEKQHALQEELASLENLAVSDEEIERQVAEFRAELIAERNKGVEEKKAVLKNKLDFLNEIMAEQEPAGQEQPVVEETQPSCEENEETAPIIPNQNEMVRG